MSLPPYLLDMPNCLIVQFLSYLDATSLYLLSKTCTRFDELIKNHTSLWKFIDARRAPNDQEKVLYCSARSHNDTHTFLTRADNHLETVAPDEFYIKINNLQNLRILALENQSIDGVRYSMMDFPDRLDEFSLKKSVVTNAADFFRQTGNHMKTLRVLILDECHWVTSSALMAICKYENLEILSVYKCKNLENSIAYLSISGQCGFFNLKIFDARLSPLGNTLLRSLYRSQSILAIYLQNEDISYKLDYFKRKLEILKGAHTRDFYVEDVEFDLNDSLTNEENGLNYEDPSALDDRGLLDYYSSESLHIDAELPQSFLYMDPYNTCTCGYEERQRRYRNQKNKKKSPPDPSSSNSDDSNDNDDQGGGGDSSIRKIENKVARLAQIIHRSQVNNSWSRGLFNHNHPRSPLAPTPIINVRNANGDAYRSLHDSEDNVCVMNLANIQGYARRRRRRPNAPSGVSKARIYDMIADAYIGSPTIPQDSDEEDNFLVSFEEFARKEKPTSYYHRAAIKVERPETSTEGTSNNNDELRFRHIIDVNINPPNGPGVPIREASTEIRKRLLGIKDEPETKKLKTDTEEPVPGPSGLNNVRPEINDESDSSDIDDYYPYMERPPTPHPDVAVNNPPNEKSDEYRRIYFRDSPVVRIESLENLGKDNKVPLRRLSLRGYNKITNTALTYIKDVDLQLLDLTYTNVSVEGIDNYLVEHPACRIVHELYCVCPTNLHF
ncbi:uncharacterized protein BDFB_004316 [Asbolus verrucosus]|uniref:F-box domain-containing protein n=1 Tax=Asbolus verrucosus TaxID=1661398 RepID=A0A482WCV2_ASBVE|nr:uncharacterized protein BDFB_004316 [Asbolus verrucosus]